MVTVTGFGFGTTRGALTLNDKPVSTSVWTDTKIVFAVPASTAADPFTGSLALSVTAANGLTSYNGLTIQSLANVTSGDPGENANNPRLAQVGPGKRFATIQAALEVARPTSALKYWLVVVWPGAPTPDNPHGQYAENVIVHHQVRIQGVGPGGFDGAGTFVPGSIIDGSGFNPDSPSGLNWVTLLSRLRYSGNPAVPDAAVVTVLNDPTGPRVPSGYPVTLDGFTIMGGAQSDFPANINVLTGGVKTPYGAAGALITQGGGVYVHSGVINMQVTDNIIRGNGGSYGGAVRVGTPYVGSNGNSGFLLARNQIRDNGGTNLAGGIGLFAGSNGYQVTGNAICGNHSAEYGGAISAFGYQGSGQNGGGTIAKNRIWFNASYDEGGGVMIAGELPADPTQLSAGSGPVTIDANVIQTNLANDDGGGIRLLQTSGSHITKTNPETINITNNTIANNVSAHEGGGLALDDSAFVNIVNNTVVKNLTTATAVTSDGTAAPAGLSTAANSAPLQARLRSNQFGSAPLAATVFSKPALLNDVFWDNRAGSFNGGTVSGTGATLPGGVTDSINTWDMGVVDVPGGLLSPVDSVLQTITGTESSSTNTVTDAPGLAAPYDVSVNILNARTNPAFRQAVIVAQLLPPSLMGDYHLGGAGSSAWGRGAASTTVPWGPTAGYTVTAPRFDIDGQARPSGTAVPPVRYDAGSDQLP